MKLHVFTVYDQAVKAFLQPFYCRSDGEALRSFGDLASDVNANVHKHPHDFILFRLGMFDDNSGLFETRDPERVVSALELLNIRDLPGPA